MEKKEQVFPNYSVYIQQGGQLKLPYSTSKRTKIYDILDARVAMANVFNKYKGGVDVVLLRYDAPYDCTITQIINKTV